MLVGCAINLSVYKVTEEGLEFVGPSGEVNREYTIQMYEGVKLDREKLATLTPEFTWDSSAFSWITAIDDDRHFLPGGGDINELELFLSIRLCPSGGWGDN